MVWFLVDGFGLCIRATQASGQAKDMKIGCGRMGRNRFGEAGTLTMYRIFKKCHSSKVRECLDQGNETSKALLPGLHTSKTEEFCL